MTEKGQQASLAIIREIQKRLDNIEDLLAFKILASDRFRKGQRVKFSPAAFRKGVARRRSVPIKGRVVAVSNSFTLTVLLDGYKKPTRYHHAFFDPVGRK
jgi:hypothetical protein